VALSSRLKTSYIVGSSGVISFQFTIWAHSWQAYHIFDQQQESGIDLAYNPVHHHRSKHIDIKYHWLRDKIADGTIAMVHVSTTDQRADILSKVASW
jgi:hypothetical protein